MRLYALIMAGGVGTRLWPRSQAERPKQFLDLVGNGRTMLQEAQARLAPLIPPEQILVATNQDYVGLVGEQLPSVPASNILGEPIGRGTAAAIGLAAIHLRRRDPQAVMAVVTADHVIADVGRFQEVLQAAVAAATDSWLVTIGIRPRYPETGFGYIERGATMQGGDGFEISRVARFREKPDRALAEEFVRSGRYSWNSGMFIWRVDRILEEFRRHMPELSQGLEQIAAALDTPAAHEVFEHVWMRFPTQTIDYGVMERAERVAVIAAEIGWNDVGSWAALYDVLPHDTAGNAVVGRHVGLNTSGSLLHSAHRLIATIGVEDLVVVDTEDVVLVCRRDRSQEVKELLAQLNQIEDSTPRPVPDPIPSTSSAGR